MVLSIASVAPSGDSRTRGKKNIAWTATDVTFIYSAHSNQKCQNNAGTQDSQTKDILEPEINDLMQPSYIYNDARNQKKNVFYDQFIY